MSRRSFGRLSSKLNFPPVILYGAQLTGFNQPLENENGY